MEIDEKKKTEDILAESVITENKKVEAAETKKAETAELEQVKTAEPVQAETAELVQAKTAETKKAETAEIEIEKVKAEPAHGASAKTEKSEAAQSPEAQKTESDKAGTKKAETAETGKSKAEKPEGAKVTTEKPTKKGRGKVIGLASLAVLVVVLAGVYIRIGGYYRTHFLPNTFVNDRNISGMDVAQAVELMNAYMQDYVLEVRGREPATAESGALLGTITSDAVGLTSGSSESTLKNIMEEQNGMLWIGSFLKKEGTKIITEQDFAIYDEERLENLVRSWNACQSVNMLPAEDAYISEYSPERQAYEIIPETKGAELDVDQAILLVGEALRDLENTMDLEEAGLYAEAEILQDDPRLTVPVETANRWLGTNIVYDWGGNEVVLDVETIQEWVTIEDGEAILDEKSVKSFVKSQSRQYDTYGKNKNFVTTAGVTLKLASASYGWRTDTDVETEELLSLILEGSIGSREPVYTHKGMVKGTDGANDIGNSYVEADLTNQHLYLYQDGEVVLETDFVSGKISNGSGTPAGIFGITYKTTDAVLRGRDYATPVKYWMPFYGNYGMHDANWRRDFGGDIYLSNGSHGCINLPPSMAEQIYQYVSKGFPVICYYYEEPLVPEGAEELPDPEATASAVDPSAEQPVPEQ